MRAQITVKGIQHMDGETAETLQQAAGILRQSPGGMTLTYKQEDTVTVVTVSSEQIIIERRGEYSSRLILETGKTHSCPYGTPYGSFMLGVTARKITNELQENGGRLTLAYELDMGSGMTTDHEIEILVKEVSQSCQRS